MAIYGGAYDNSITNPNPVDDLANIIGYNRQNGVYIGGSGTNGNLVYFATIAYNGNNGVQVDTNATDNVIDSDYMSTTGPVACTLPRTRAATRSSIAPSCTTHGASSIQAATTRTSATAPAIIATPTTSISEGPCREGPSGTPSLRASGTRENESRRWPVRQAGPASRPSRAGGHSSTMGAGALPGRWRCAHEVSEPFPKYSIPEPRRQGVPSDVHSISMNVISSNISDGVQIMGSGTTGNVVEGKM